MVVLRQLVYCCKSGQDMIALTASKTWSRKPRCESALQFEVLDGVKNVTLLAVSNGRALKDGKSFKRE